MGHEEHDWLHRIADVEVWNWLEGTLCRVFASVIDSTIEGCPACEQAFEAKIERLMATDPARAELRRSWRRSFRFFFAPKARSVRALEEISKASDIGVEWPSQRSDSDGTARLSSTAIRRLRAKGVVQGLVVLGLSNTWPFLTTACPWARSSTSRALG